MPVVTAGDVLAITRTYLNDDGANNWTDSSLMPKLGQAHRELQAKLRSYAVPVMQKMSAGINVASATTTITAPDDLVEPIRLWEKLQGSGDSTYILMTEQYPLDIAETQAATLRFWQWQDETITFIGSSTARTVKMLYWRSLDVPDENTDSILVTNGELYLGPRTAAIASGAVGNKEAYAALTDIADSKMMEVILANRGRLRPNDGQTMRP